MRKNKMRAQAQGGKVDLSEFELPKFEKFINGLHESFGSVFAEKMRNVISLLICEVLELAIEEGPTAVFSSELNGGTLNGKVFFDIPLGSDKASGRPSFEIDLAHIDTDEGAEVAKMFRRLADLYDPLIGNGAPVSLPKGPLPNSAFERLMLGEIG